MPKFYVSYEQTKWIETKAQSIEGAQRAARENCPFTGCEIQIGVFDKEEKEIVMIAYKNNEPMNPQGNEWTYTPRWCPQAMWRYE